MDGFLTHKGIGNRDQARPYYHYWLLSSKKCGVSTGARLVGIAVSYSDVSFFTNQAISVPERTSDFDISLVAIAPSGDAGEFTDGSAQQALSSYKVSTRLGHLTASVCINCPKA
eukprot:scaffold14008_cov36-Prasinocladus_malaysianus.AAC.1